METCAVDERMRFMLAVDEQEESFSTVCRRFGVSRKTGYKWLDRYREAGVQGLVERSRAPQRHDHAVSDEIAERCLAVRRRTAMSSWLESSWFVRSYRSSSCC
jgi:transposase